MAPVPPRYAPHRPLPERPFRPGTGQPRPRAPAAPPHPEGPSTLHPAHPRQLTEVDVDAFRHGVDLYNAGCWWEAHEAWEDLWHRAQRRSPLYHLLRGLIMLAAAHLKHVAGQSAGCSRLLARALENLREAHGGGLPSAPLQLPLAPLLEACAAWQRSLAADSTATPPAALHTLWLREHPTPPR